MQLPLYTQGRVGLMILKLLHSPLCAFQQTTKAGLHIMSHVYHLFLFLLKH